MMPLMGELYTHIANSFDIQRGMPPEDVLSERVRFVRAMGWYPEDYSDDRDEYDSREDTYHFARRDDNGSIIAAMRLTPIEHVESSLSFGMMNANPELQSAVASSPELKVDSAMWDLTRLVFCLDEPRDDNDIQDAMIELFGMAARISAGELDDAKQDIHWVFTTTPSMIRFFRQTGINCKIIAGGKLADVHGKLRTTLFCLVDGISAIEALRTNEEYENTYLHLRKGADEAEIRVAYV